MKENSFPLHIRKIVYAFVLAFFFTLFQDFAFYTQILPQEKSDTAYAAGNIEVWWPQDGGNYSGTVPLKAILSGNNVETYSMSWRVDGGSYSSMGTSPQDYPHKETSIDLKNWTWKGVGPYLLKFAAFDLSGNLIAEKSIQIKNSGYVSTQSSTVSTTVEPPQNKTISVWWPSTNAVLSGTQTLKAVLSDTVLNQYNISYEVEGKAVGTLLDSYTDHPHKELAVNTNEWNWNSNGEYKITFRATNKNGEVLAIKDLSVIGQKSATTSVPAPIQLSNNSNPFSGQKFYINPYSNAKRQISMWQSSRPEDASQLEKIATEPDAEWFGDWNTNIEIAVREYKEKALAQSAVPVMVAYNIPSRDCGSYSAGGAVTLDNYKNWIRGFARGIGSSKAIVILEPDALPGLGCLPISAQEDRLALLQDAVRVLKTNPNTAVYIDAGHANWISADETALRLIKAGISEANGFSLNISNFIASDQNIIFGTAVSQKVNGKHFVVDTSRNGNGSNGQWCNPAGRALGIPPTSLTNQALVDAYFWIKKPGDSDGSCNGAPSAGTWMPEYALELARNTR